MEFTGSKPTGTPRQSKPVTERRHSTRLAVHSPAYASLNGSSAKKSSDLSEILDVSEGGVSIQTASPLEVGRNLNLSLDLSETETKINAAGQVVWSNNSGRAGIHFTKLPSHALRQLKEWLFVNVLTAFDHAKAWTLSAEAQQAEVAAPNSRRTSHSGQGLPNGSSRFESRGSARPSSENRAEKPPIQKPWEGNGDESGDDRLDSLQSIVERALNVTRATGAAIALSVGEEMICQASAGSDAPPLGSRLQASSGFSGECVRTGRCLRCDDSETDDRVDRASCRVLGIRSIIAVPVRSEHRVTGLLEVFSSEAYAFNAKDISELQQLGGTIVASSRQGSGSAAPMSLATADPPAAGRMSPAPEPVPRRLPERSEERPEPDFLAASMEQTSPRWSAHKIVLAFAILTFLLAVTWLVAPWVTSRMAASNRSAAQTAAKTEDISSGHSRQLNLPIDASNLAGLRQVAERGDPAAQFALGARYATGEEVNQDYSEAVRWFRLAAEQGHILAQATLGAYYWAGRGVAPDLTKAYFWSALAQAGGDQASKYRVAVLASRMSRSDILAAQQQANDWLRNHQVAGNVPPSH